MFLYQHHAALLVKPANRNEDAELAHEREQVCAALKRFTVQCVCFPEKSLKNKGWILVKIKR